MKSNQHVLLAALSLALSTPAFAGTLVSFTGQPSPLQHLTCGSTEVNIGIDVQGNTAQIQSNDVPATYSCTGTISKNGTNLSCTTTDEAPAKFELHAGPNLSNAQFSFSGNDGSVPANCQF
jgi:hypothetical protein